jgi:hypothetical protein
MWFVTAGPESLGGVFPDCDDGGMTHLALTAFAQVGLILSLQERRRLP